MRVSLKWLCELVGELPDAGEVARRLTAVGLEVEAIERLGRGLAGVVAARVLSLERHPDAEKLSVVRVDSGEGPPLQIVCGARNFRVGELVPLATVGTVLPGGQKIERARLRGVDSHGMLCSARELGISSDGSGLLILPSAARPGEEVARVLGLEDVVLEVNVTPNRPDALSHLGIARELSALLDTPLRRPEPQVAESGPPAAEAVKVRIEAPEKCARYTARVIEGVRIGPSPAWLTRRLESCGVRSISNVVDATNLVLLELGHPLHAFDLEKVAGREIVVRTARPGEHITTLDGKDRALVADDLLIADRDRGSALAGVMGGGDSEISDGTTRVLLESAWFQPETVRRTSRRHGLKTEASYRFERGADPGMVLPAVDRCAALIAELSGGAVRPGVVDAHPRPFRSPEVRLRFGRPAEVLGLDVPRGEAERILSRLGFEERAPDAEGATWAVPSWRVDVSLEEDLIEELVRFKGYEAIPETLPAITMETPAQSDESRVVGRIRTALEACGFSEAVNFSFVAARELESFGSSVVTADGSGRALGVFLKNPITADLAVMRTSLVPSLLKNAVFNRRQRVEDVRLYEVARTYEPNPLPADAPSLEPLRVAGVLLGRRHPVGWAVGGEAVDFYDAKAAVEGVLRALGIGGVAFGAPGEGWLHPRLSAVLSAGDRLLGAVGEIHPRVAQAFDLPRGVLAFELRVEALVGAAQLVSQYRPIPRFPAVLRDLAIVVDEGAAAAEVEAAIREEPLVEAVTLFDVYRGAPLPRSKKNLALAIRYRAADRTLTDAEADLAHAHIVERLRKALGAELRG